MSQPDRDLGHVEEEPSAPLEPTERGSERWTTRVWRNKGTLLLATACLVTAVAAGSQINWKTYFPEPAINYLPGLALAIVGGFAGLGLGVGVALGIRRAEDWVNKL